MEQSIIEKAKNIKVLLLDVDGVLTDGRIIYDSGGRDLKFFDVHDGMAVYLLGKAGIPTVLVTAKDSRTIRPRARDMRVDLVFANISSKSSILEKVFKKYKVESKDLCFIGDDLVDLGLMKRVGMAVAVANGCEEIKNAACLVTRKEGGRGAVREVIEIILKAQGKWDGLVKIYDV